MFAMRFNHPAAGVEKLSSDKPDEEVADVADRYYAKSYPENPLVSAGAEVNLLTLISAPSRYQV
jgi:hypothetical protein